MSYILDALKKADAERERDAAAVPDLHAQPEAAVGRLPGPGGAGRMLVFAMAGLLLMALAWWWFGGSPSTAPPPLPATARVSEPAALPAAPTVVPPAPAAAPVQAPVQAPIAVAPPRTLPPPAPTLPTVRVPAPATKTPATAPVPPTTAAASAPRLPTLAELPPALRAQMPTLVVGGSVYSTQAASRMVILGGQVFREGDRPAEGLLVEQIGLKSTVLSFRGQRFELKH